MLYYYVFFKSKIRFKIVRVMLSCFYLKNKFQDSEWISHFSKVTWLVSAEVGSETWSPNFHRDE